MARSQNQPTPPDRAKVRVFYGEADGSSQSIQDLVRLLGHVVRPPQHTLHHNLAGALPAPSLPKQVDPVDDHAVLDGFSEAEESVVDGLVASDSTADGKPQRRRRGEGPKISRNAGIQLVSGLDFVQDGKQPLKEFFVEKNPKKDMEQVLVFGFYLQEVMELAHFSPGHILSAYKHIGDLNIPLDLKATLRNMKKGKGWLTFADFDHMRVDTEGQNYVKTVLGKEKVKPR